MRHWHHKQRLRSRRLSVLGSRGPRAGSHPHAGGRPCAGGGRLLAAALASLRLPVAALSAAVVVALLATAGVAQATSLNPGTVSCTATTCTDTIGADTTTSWTAPAGVSSVDVTLYGANGGFSGAAGGLGAEVTGTVAVTGGSTSLALTVGGSDGYNGGGSGGDGGAKGGGATDLSLGGTLLLVAGGGGGSGGEGDGAGSGPGDGGNADYPGYAGYGSVSDDGATLNPGGGGGVGTIDGGGADGAGGTVGGSSSCEGGDSAVAGLNGQPGTLGQGGSGGSSTFGSQGGGGGGGGGYYGGGGGGGGAGDDCEHSAGGGGGGGGASYGDDAATELSNVNLEAGLGSPNGNGRALLQYSNPVAIAGPLSYVASAGQQLSATTPGLLINATDTGGATLTAGPASESTAQGGTVSINSNGSFSYTPPDFSGTDTFGYVVTDPYGDYVDATASVDVLQVSQAITGFSLASPVTAGTTASLSATGGDSGQPVEFSVDPSSGSGVCSVTNTGVEGDPGTTGAGSGTVSYLEAGTCVIDADQAASPGGGWSAAGQVQQTVSVNQVASGVSLPSGDSFVYGQPMSVTATVTEADSSSPSGTVQFKVDGTNVGAPVSVSSGEAVSPYLGGGTLASGSYALEAVFTPANPDVYASKTATGTFDVTAASQSITGFSLPASATAGTQASLSAAGGDSGQPVEFSVDPSSGSGVCSVANTGVVVGFGTAGVGSGTVSYLKAGTCVVDANQAADGADDYVAATQVQQTIVVSQVSSGLSVASGASFVYGQPVSVTAHVTEADTSDPAGTVQFKLDGSDVGSPVSVSGGQAASPDLSGGGTLAAGSHTVRAVFTPTDQNVYASQTTAATFSVTAAPQTITFSPLTTAATAGSHASLSATGGGSGKPVEFSVDGQSGAGVCSVAQTGSGAGTVSYLKAGSCVIDADQAADAAGDYALAPQVRQTVTVSQVGSDIGAPSPAATVYGQSVTVSATVSEADSSAPAGSVQFELDGVVLGSPVAVADGGAATSPDLNAKGTLAVGSHTVMAVFTPSDGAIYAPASWSTTVLVGRAATHTSIVVGSHSLTARVMVVAPGAGTPSGTVTFKVGGQSIGTAKLSGGTAKLDHSVQSGRSGRVAVVYAGDANFTGSSASTARSNPTITAKLSSRVRRTRSGWYRAPVTVRFACATHGAPLTSPCPRAVTLRRSGAGQSVRRTITASNGGVASVVVSPIDIDLSRPVVRLTGVRRNGLYEGRAPRVGCVAHDRTSGIAGCVIRRHSSTSHTGLDVTTTRYRLTATNRAGASATVTGSYRTLGIYLQGVRYHDGSFLITLGRTYTIVAAIAGHDAPRYIDAAPGPGAPAGNDQYFHTVAGHRWALGVTLTRGLTGLYRRWALGVEIGGRVHRIEVEAP